ncbi:putative uncharacterized protein DDB_G0271982 [Acyrthosiphon pisum]|uniref:Uncharacterized protein n=1 Tax=Acyrthosiphon pisum TaxID=7029 RepID=A0A8R2AAZ9_ACYPI|nr:putative uncharacterized protein DDB_G0271982 [Acyrthosiphon pisum]|eukprot:XP_003241898.1 PREDICTED: putative uncharacterized protein DDB_G0271982 [Acyrthosiphon pisum]
MKHYIINPLYTAIFSMIIFAALSSSFDLNYFGTKDGKLYVNSTYEIVKGGNIVLNIGPYNIPGLKSYRKLTPNEKLEVRKLEEEFNIEREKERISRENEREKEQRRREVEKRREQKYRDEEKRRNQIRREKERQKDEAGREKDLQIRISERAQNDLEREMRDLERQRQQLKRNMEQQQRDAERAQRDAERAERDAERARRDVERAYREVKLSIPKWNVQIRPATIKRRTPNNIRIIPRNRGTGGTGVTYRKITKNNNTINLYE